MTIETKFSINDVVWFMDNNKPRVGRINRIMLSVCEGTAGSNNIAEVYCFEGTGLTKDRVQVHGNKEELLNSL